MAKKKKKLKRVEVFFNKSVERPYDGCDAISTSLGQIAGFDKTPERFPQGWYNQFGEFGSGISSMDIFDAEEAEKIYNKLLKHVGKKVGNDRKIKSVEIKDWP